jgi:FtsP/CotA-like multicopper oxidase with cupredoxin domain
MHPGEQVLMRVIGQGRWQHPFHEHANHVRILARDGNLILSQTDPNSLPDRCCSPPRPLRGWPSTGSSTSRARA